VEADILRGDWADPRLAKTTVVEWSERWLRTRASLKPKTLAGYESNLRAHVLPAFGSHELRHIDRMAVEEWVADLQASGLGPSAVRQHDLRHTCSSLLIAQGAHPKAIQIHLGHSSIAVTMDRYGHLFPSDMEALAVALDAVRTRALADQMRTNDGPEVIELGP
jgi:integrase